MHHDIWDYDLASPPALVTIRRDGREIPAVVQMTKSGVMFVLDRRTGEPLFPIEERPMPASHVPGEQAWPTQPYPVEARAARRDTRRSPRPISPTSPPSRVRSARTSSRDSAGAAAHTSPIDTTAGVWFPGTLGGATWSGASIDPQLGYAFVNVNEVGAIGAMRRKPSGASAPGVGALVAVGDVRAVLGSQRSALPASAVGKADRGEPRDGRLRLDASRSA